MTLGEGISRVLERSGLSTGSTDYQAYAREDMSLILAEVLPVVPWWWLDRTTTFDTTSGTRTYSPISSQVTAWYSFVNESDDRTLTIVGPEWYDSVDVDQDDSGTIEVVFIAGVDATTGYPVIELWRTPSSTETIRVRYRIDIDEFTSSDDDSSFQSLGLPRIMENVLIHGATSLMLERNGDDTGSARESANFERTLKAAKRQNLDMRGKRRFKPWRPRPEAIIRIGTDIVTE